MQVYSASGRRILPTMALDLACCYLHAGKDWQLLAVQLDGLLHLWDLEEGRLIIKTHLPAIQNADGTFARQLNPKSCTAHALPKTTSQETEEADLHG